MWVGWGVSWWWREKGNPKWPRRGRDGALEAAAPGAPPAGPAQWVHPIPEGSSHPMSLSHPTGSVPRHRVRPMPWKLPERSRPRGWARGRWIGHFTHQLPKMVAPTLPSPSARMHPRGGEGQGQPPAREGAGNGSQDGIRGRN